MTKHEGFDIIKCSFITYVKGGTMSESEKKKSHWPLAIAIVVTLFVGVGVALFFVSKSNQPDYSKNPPACISVVTANSENRVKDELYINNNNVGDIYYVKGSNGCFALLVYGYDRNRIDFTSIPCDQVQVFANTCEKAQ